MIQLSLCLAVVHLQSPQSGISLSRLRINNWTVSYPVRGILLVGKQSALNGTRKIGKEFEDRSESLVFVRRTPQTLIFFSHSSLLCSSTNRTPGTGPRDNIRREETTLF